MSAAASDLTAAFAAALGDAAQAGLGLAVSGGGDSVAVLRLARDWADKTGTRLAVATVNHGLRAEAVSEAAFVADLCADLDIPHHVLNWSGWDGQGNLMDQARRARYRLIADWAGSQGLGTVALGHTADDQAETFLMRLARGSGVDGLSGMAARHRSNGILWLRPVLDQRRADLQAYLRQIGQSWIDDPSNDDPRFDRVRIRQTMAVLQDLGLSVQTLTATADRMAMARAALEQAAVSAAADCATIDQGDVVFQIGVLAGLPDETRLRLLSAAICWVASADYRPRLSALTNAWSELLAGRQRPLHGAMLIPKNQQLRVTRDPAAVAGLCTPFGALWDGRWRISGPESNGLEVRALGAEGLTFCPDWRESGRPRMALLASPALWSGDHLIAAPLAGFGNGYRAELAQGAESFALSLIAH